MSPFAQNQPENFFSGITDVLLIKYQTPSTPDECRINPVRFCAKTDEFWGVLAPGDSNAQEKNTDWIYLVCTRANMLLNIFNGVGQVLHEIQGGAWLLVVHDF